MQLKWKELGHGLWREKQINVKRRKRINDLQYSRGFTNEFIAKELGMTKERWKQFKQSYDRLRGKHYKRLLELFGEDVHYLFYGVYVNKMVPEFKRGDEI